MKRPSEGLDRRFGALERCSQALERGQVGPGTAFWEARWRQVGRGTAFWGPDGANLALERRFGHLAGRNV